jgi:hypothetical protein
MGEVVQIADYKPEAGYLITDAKLRPEPRGYLLVPARVLDVLKRLEDSVEAYTADQTGKAHIDWKAYFHLMAILEMAPRYTQ